ncbi:hypothetical protein Fmac_015017 [Flemingia macrophylla]|uniref:Uncharacterized protein n=1 Tax=Flemingia macrophylla TaxID=520843 RepID=A0ABD1MDE8_9FABA
MPRLPTIKARAISAATTVTTAAAAAAPKAAAAAAATAAEASTGALCGGAIPRHVSKSATPEARSASSSSSATATAAAAGSGVPSAHAVPGEMAKPAAAEASAPGGGAGTAVAVAGEVAELAALVAGGGGGVAAGGRAGLEGCDVDGLGLVVVAGGDAELDAIALEEGPVAVGSDGGLVDEEILAAVVGLDEAEALAVVEPLYHSRESLFRHDSTHKP